MLAIDDATLSDSPWPVLVDIQGKYTVALMNRKAYNKSLENNTPWILHPRTSRLLPWPGAPKILSIEESPGAYNMKLPKGTVDLPYGKEFPCKIDPDNREKKQPMVGDDIKFSTVLVKLSQIIAHRHKEKSDGSYTAHLFASGQEKIRKKMGEEAVELLLARDKKDVTFETADLLFHILVLLEELGIDWTDVETELARRF